MLKLTLTFTLSILSNGLLGGNYLLLGGKFGSSTDAKDLRPFGGRCG